MSNRRDFTNKNTKFTGVLGIEVPGGSTAQRSGSPALGTLRYNSDQGLAEFYTPTGWAGVDAPPVVTNVTGTINENTDSTITITGTGFKNGALVIIAGTAVSNVDRTLTTTFVNGTSLTAATNATAVNYVGGASFNVKVLNPSGLTGELVNAGAIDRDPVFSTAAGSLGNYVGVATGGTVTEYSTGGTTYRVHTFYDSGTFTLNSTTSCDILLVGGGGGGHGGYQSPAGGGGGAGGLVYYKARSMSAGSYTVGIGAQGNGGFGDTNGGAYVAPTAGGSTSFTGLTSAVGGGRGGGYETTPSTTGGSGGGGNYWGDGNAAVNRSGTTNQGNAGGAGSTDTSGQNSGGGGGAGGAGENGQGNGGRGGVGGNGVLEGTTTIYNFQTGSTTTFEINGSGQVYCAGGASGIGYNADTSTSFQRVNGGNAGGTTRQTGGTGGQNFESNLAGGNAEPYTGSGGGGAGGIISGNTNAYGGNGSKGVAIVRYALPAGYTNFTIAASDPESTAVTYSLASGSLPSGMTFNSNGTITGNPTTIPASNTTYSFSVNATSNGQTSTRSFSFIVPTRPADSGPGGGFSVAQGADATEALGVTTTSQTKYQTRVGDQGAGADSFNFQSGTFGFHTGHQSLWWPSFTAIQVSSATYGRVLNQMQWYKHANSCGNFDIYGSNQNITSGNYTDLSLWTHLGRNFSGGPGSGDESGLMTFGFNPQHYGFRWYLIHIADASYVRLPYPMVGNRQGWANYGCRLNCISPGGNGSSAGTAAINGIAIKNQGLPSGYYWIKPYGETARYCYVDNTNYGGGWVLVQTVGSGTNHHWNQTGDFNLYNDGVKSYVPFSGTGYDSTSGRRYADSFVVALGHGGGGEGVFRLEIARNGASPSSDNTLTNSTDYKCAQFTRMDKNMKWYASSNNGSLGDVAQRSFDIAHYYPYETRWEHGNYNNATGSNANGHFQVFNSNYKVFDGHSNPSSINSSLYSSVRFLWGYTGASGNGIYGGSTYGFNLNNDGNPGYMWIR